MEEEEEQWKHHDALPLLHGSTRRTAKGIVLQTREPKARSVFWAFSPWPGSPDTTTPPDNFLQHHMPPAAFNSLASSLPPDLFIKVAASRSPPLSSAFSLVGVHTAHLGPLAPFFPPSPSPSLSSSPYKFSLKPYLHFSTLLSLLSLAYSSSPLSTLTEHCTISCVEDLVDIFDIISSLDILADFRSALSMEPLCSIIARFKHSQSVVRARDDDFDTLETRLHGSNLTHEDRNDDFYSAKTRVHGFNLTHEDRENLNMIFLDIVDMPYRTKFLQDGLLIVSDTPLFIQDVTNIIVPRGHTSDQPMRSYCLLVPKTKNSYIIYSFISFFQFVSLNAQVHAKILGCRKALSFITYEEIFVLSFEVSIFDRLQLNLLARSYYLKVNTIFQSSINRDEFGDENSALVEFSGTMENIQQFLLELLRFKPLLEKTSSILKMQRLSYLHFLHLFSMIDICNFSFLKHMAIITDKLYYISAIITRMQMYSSISRVQTSQIPSRVKPERPTKEARRIMEVLAD